jgi:MinD superfamily P-loop ATPase
VIDPAACTGCGACLAHCRFDAVLEPGASNDGAYRIDPLACEGCGLCAAVCEAGAVRMEPRTCGTWSVSDTRAGPMVHARLDVAGENSGRLVSLVRKEARALAERERRDLLIVDGPPGTGCPVIASITGADAVLVVTEPTVSGEHDLGRVLDLAAHFGTAAAVCINKSDLNPAMADRIEYFAAKRGAPVLGRLPYDDAATAAQLHARAVVEEDNGPLARGIRELWTQCLRILPGENGGRKSRSPVEPRTGAVQ